MKVNDFENYRQNDPGPGIRLLRRGRISEIIKPGDRDYLFTVAGTEVYEEDYIRQGNQRS
ncbi:hypothetical protein [Acetobacterium sp.]|uniref:hypothetical protein n=1 Tax=Acetobacterium sp. TaxID=1872094 RepID=UPI0035937599